MIAERGNVVLVGTAHVSPESVKEVRAAIEAHAPDVVCVELDEHRARALTDPRWRETPLLDVIKQGKAAVLLAQAFLASYQRRLGDQYGVKPGAEMLEAMAAAKERGIPVELADRDIAVTMRRAWRRMRFREKLRLFWEFMKALTGAEEGHVEISDLMKEDVLSAMMEELSRAAPSIHEVLIQERDAYLAGRIIEAGKRGRVVAVVGAGHVKGILAHLDRPDAIPPRATLETVPERFPWGKVLGYGLAVAILAAIVWLAYVAFVTGNFQQLQDKLVFFVLATGSFSALGALAALAHPFSIATAFLAAPFATIHPAIATGWFSGYVELKIRKPTVGDYEGLSRLLQLRDFYRNKITRILLVTALTNVGAMIGFWVGGVELFRAILGG